MPSVALFSFGGVVGFAQRATARRHFLYGGSSAGISDQVRAKSNEKAAHITPIDTKCNFRQGDLRV